MKLQEQYKLLFEKKDHIIKRLNNLTDEQKEVLINFFKDRPNLESKIDWNNTELTFSDFSDVMKPSKTQKKKSFKIHGLDDMTEGDDYLKFPIQEYPAFIPLTHDASVKLASHYIGNSEGQWCTAQSDDDDYFYEYCVESGKVLIYIITDKTKYAVATNPNASFEYSYEIFTAKDDQISATDLEEQIGIDIVEYLGKNSRLLQQASDDIIELNYESEEDYYSSEIFEEIKISNEIEEGRHKGTDIIYNDCTFINCYGKVLYLQGSDTLWTIYPERLDHKEATLFDTYIEESLLCEDEKKEWFGVLEDTDWEDGTFDGGTFEGDYAEWKYGEWLGGTFDAYIWHDGNWYSGEWVRGQWLDGRIYSNKYNKLVQSGVNPNEFYKKEEQSNSLKELMNMVG